MNFPIVHSFPCSFDGFALHGTAKLPLPSFHRHFDRQISSRIESMEEEPAQVEMDKSQEVQTRDKKNTPIRGAKSHQIEDWVGVVDPEQ